MEDGSNEAGRQVQKYIIKSSNYHYIWIDLTEENYFYA